MSGEVCVDDVEHDGDENLEDSQEDVDVEKEIVIDNYWKLQACAFFMKIFELFFLSEHEKLK